MPSTAIRSVTYDQAERELRVGFVGGGEYAYLDVPAVVHTALLAAVSKGTFVNEVVKPHFAFRRLKSGDIVGTEGTEPLE